MKPTRFSEQKNGKELQKSFINNNLEVTDLFWIPCNVVALANHLFAREYNYSPCSSPLGTFRQEETFLAAEEQRETAVFAG